MLLFGGSIAPLAQSYNHLVIKLPSILIYSSAFSLYKSEFTSTVTLSVIFVDFHLYILSRCGILMTHQYLLNNLMLFFIGLV